MNEKLDIRKIMEYQREFVKARDWAQFHTPKNLSMALTGEIGELNEIFQWLSEKESTSIMQNSEKGLQVRNELADILYYLCRLADVLQVDLEDSFWEKTRLNEKKYPVSLSKGNAKKYTELVS